MHRVLFVFFIFIANFQLSSQNLSAKIVDSATQSPIPFAAIQLDSSTGTITNEEGFFTIRLKDPANSLLTISCMGYTTKTLSYKAIEEANFVIILEEATNQLDEVYLSNKRPNADSIISKVIANISKNYEFNNKKHNVFYRNKTGFNFKKLNFNIEKATGFRKKKLVNANNSLDSMSRVIIDSKSTHFIDALGDLYVRDKDSSKLKLEKVTMLLDKKNNFSIESVQDKAQAIVFKYLDEDKSYKVKSGLFKIEDSLTFEDVKQKEKKQTDSIDTSDLRQGAMRILKKSNLLSGSFLKQFLDTELYDYEHEDIVYFNNELIHIIKFSPDKAKAKFSGTLYITDESFAVVKADYTYAKGKRGKKLNLRLILGVKFIDNYKKGTFVFQKTGEKYTPRYLTEESGQYIYVHRPIKFIENETRNKVSFDILIEGSTRSKTEVLFNSQESINSIDFNSFKEVKQTEFLELQHYNPEIWNSYDIIEPLEEMKQF